MKRLVRVIGVCSFLLIMIGFSAFAVNYNSYAQPTATTPPVLRLPPGTNPQGTITANFSAYRDLSFSDASFHVTLSFSGSGFAVDTTTTYLGWCLEDFQSPTTPTVKLYSSYDPNMPDDIRTYQFADIPIIGHGFSVGDPVPWAEANWILNNKGALTRDDIQNAIHLTIWGDASILPISQAAQDLAAAAKTHNDFVPTAGQTIGVILYADGLGTGLDGRPDQETIIEVPVNPAVTIVKYTNGQTAADPNGPAVPQVNPGDPVTWTYKVTNTGNISIDKASVTVTDNQTGVTPTFDMELSGNGDTSFDPGEVWQYIATGSAVDLGSPPAGVITQPNACTENNTQPPRTAYVNMGTATIPGATSSITSSYCNPPNPAVTIVKYTNGQTAADPNGAGVPLVKPGDPVTWTYKVTNTGNVPIARANVSVTDNQTGVTPAFDVEITGNGDTIFDPGEVWQYKATGSAVDLGAPPAGIITQPNACTENGTQPARTAYVNMGTATIPGATASVSSSYCNPLVPAVTIVKYTNGSIASDPNGTDVPQLRPGDAVTWTYKVTNTGEVSIPMASVAVTDNQPGITPVFDHEITGNGDASFDPGEVWQFKATGVAVDTTLNPPGVTIVHNGCSYNGTIPQSPAYVNTATITIPGASASALSSYCNPVHYPFFGENGYLGIEDWFNGDYDYNDFGMYIRMEEEITWSCVNVPCGPYLTRVIVTTTSVIHDSAMSHLIHLTRPFNGSYSYTVTRGVPADPDPLVLFDGTSGKETPAGTFTGSGDLNVVLYNTAKYGRHQKQIGEQVVVDITLNDPLLNPRTNGTPPRSYTVGSNTFTDLDPIMGNYDFWEEGNKEQSRWHLKDTLAIGGTGNESFGLYTKLIPAGTVVPFMIVVPYTNWIPPFELSTITGPYGLFMDYYTTSLPTDWFMPAQVTNTCVQPGGLSFGPYPGQQFTCGGGGPQPNHVFMPAVSQ